jgi:hypothetical protein
MIYVVELCGEDDVIVQSSSPKEEVQKWQLNRIDRTLQLEIIPVKIDEERRS